MKKTYSLIKSCMTSDMSIFKIKTKNNKLSNKFILIFISLCFMSTVWIYANALFEIMAPMNLQFIVLSLFAFLISVMTIIEGIYKSGSLMFNCKDDDLLLSLPIKKRTVLFVRIFKFYIFELLFNSLFIVPLTISYIRWANTLEWTFFLTSIAMIFLLPIIPIIISCIIGAISVSISSRFKYKNIAQIITTLMFLLGILLISSNSDKILEYLIKNAASINDLITKIYYPAGVYATLTTNFSFTNLIIFILVNFVLFTITIFILSKFYFKINSRIKTVETTKKSKISNLNIKSRSIRCAFIKKELTTFFTTPVFIINSGFGLVLFIVGTFIACLKFDSVLLVLTDPNGINLSRDLINNNISLLILFITLFTSYMTSITNSLISLEGRSINILKTLPIKIKTILMSKIYSCLVITTPILLIGNIILFIRFKVSIIESLLLIVLSILIPLVSHFIGLLVNLKYPKLDAQNATEVVKQSMSSFLSVLIGMILLVINALIIIKIVGLISSVLILFIFVIVYLIIDILLYLLLINVGVKNFKKLSI